MPESYRPTTICSAIIIGVLIALFALVTNLTALAQERLIVIDCSTGTHYVKSGRFDCANATGGTTAYTILSVPSTLNPVTAIDTASSAIQDHIFGLNENSYAQLATGVDGLTPQAASSIEVNNNGSEITYKLRPNLRFSDGSPVDGEDVLYWYYDVIMNPDLPNPMSSRFICPDTNEPFEVVSPTSDTVVVRCSSPFAQFTVIAAGLPVMSRQMALDLISDQNIPTEFGRIADRATREFLGLDTDLDLIRGLGPFVLTELDPQSQASYARNEFFYEYDSAGTQLPYLDELEVLIEASQGAEGAFNDFIDGRTDVVAPRLGDVSAIFGQAFSSGFRVNSNINNATPSRGMQFVLLNFDDTNSALAEAARDPNVRHALSLAIDRPSIINSIYFSFGTPQYLPVGINNEIADSYFLGRDNTCSTFADVGLSCDNSTGLINAQGMAIQPKRLPPPGVTAELDEHLQCLSDRAFCVERANGILDSAGYGDSDGDNTRNLSDGSEWRIVLKTNTGGLAREAVISEICSHWNEIGIDCTTETVSFNQAVREILAIGGATWSGAYVLGLNEGDPTQNADFFTCGGALYIWHQSCDPTASTGPSARVPSLAAIGDAFNAGINAPSFRAAQTAFDELQRAWSQSEPLMLLGINNELFAFRSDHICNTGREITANDDVKFRVDVSGNSGACSNSQ